MKSLLWFRIISALNLGVVVPPAIARMPMEPPTAKGAEECKTDNWLTGGKR